MTILIAIRRNGVTVILSDTAVVSRKQGRDQITDELAIKTGVLYPGCIFGVCGYWAGAEPFVTGLKRKIEAAKSPAENWAKLEEHIRRSNFSPARAFTMVFATRHQGVSELFVFDSNQDALGLQHQVGDVYLDGSGKPFLEEQVAILSEIVFPKSLSPEHHVGHVDADLFAYVALLSFRQRAEGDDGHLFSAHLINDELHFIAQDSTTEWRQRPSLLIVGSALGRNVQLDARRVAFQGDTLIRWNWDGIGLGRWQCIFPVETGDIPLPDRERKRLSDEAIATELATCPYYFLGVGAPLRRGRPIHTFLHVFDGDTYLADPERFVSQVIVEFLGHASTGTLPEALTGLKADIANLASYRHWRKKPDRLDA